MNFFKYSTYVLFIALLWSCKKKEYPDSVIVNDAEYYTTMNIDGTPVVIQAGVGSFYMYSSTIKDTNDIHVLQSELRKIDCLNCPRSLMIQFTDYKIASNSVQGNIDSALQIKKYEYLNYNQGVGYKVQFFSSYNKPFNNQNYHWTISDGSEYYGPNPVHTFTNAGIYQVCLEVIGNNSCVSAICNTISVGDNALITSIDALTSSDTTITFSNNTIGGKPPYFYQWNFGDGNTETNAGTIHAYKYPGAYAVTIKVTDSEGASATARYNAITKTDLSSCAANFKISSIQTLQHGTQHFSKIKIRWIDDAGNEFNSDERAQNNNAYFEVVSISEGSLNEKNERTKKVKIKFSCILYKGMQEIKVTDADAVIAISYK